MTRVSALVLLFASCGLGTALTGCLVEPEAEEETASGSPMTPGAVVPPPGPQAGNPAGQPPANPPPNEPGAEPASAPPQQPGAAPPDVNMPPAGNPPAGNPPAGNPPAGNPPAGNPPAGNPPAGNPAAEPGPPMDTPQNPPEGGAGAAAMPPTAPQGGAGAPPVSPPAAPAVDANGKSDAKPGERTDVVQDYLKFGDIRILNNNWGSEDLGCTAPKSTMSVFVDDARRFGWEFDRGDCAGPTDRSHPDFPQVEFGIHPFGIGTELETSPGFSSTTVLPLQLGAVQSASVSVQDLRIELQKESSWNLTMEFWLSERDPREPNPGVYAEIMAFWGWQGGRWPSSPGADGASEGGSGTGDSVAAGDKSYVLWVQRDNWASGWRYFQFRADSGPQRSYNGTIDVKAFLDYLKNRGYPDSLWLTRLEVGSEIDDETSGKVSMSGITFEVNGESRSATLGSN